MSLIGSFEYIQKYITNRHLMECLRVMKKIAFFYYHLLSELFIIIIFVWSHWIHINVWWQLHFLFITLYPDMYISVWWSNNELPILTIKQYNDEFTMWIKNKQKKKRNAKEDNWFLTLFLMIEETNVKFSSHQKANRMLLFFRCIPSSYFQPPKFLNLKLVLKKNFLQNYYF